MVQIVIFDLDGTLLDTVGDLAASCNEVLNRRGLPTYDIETYRTFVGNGVLRLVERAIPEELRTPELIAEVRAEFVEYYSANINKNTHPYEGIKLLLRELQYRDISIAVASNKFQEGTRKLIKIFFPEIRFAAVLGQRENVPLKPSPTIIREIFQITSYTPDKAIFIGDSAIDILTAKAAGIKSIGVTWGFRPREELIESGADYIADTTKRIIEILDL
ncbi:MAG: HAD hydrolase-like protein [Rikenellaceae bacterium]